MRRLTVIGLALGALTVLAGCAPPRQLASYVVADPDGMSDRMAMLCYWGLHDCADDVAAPDGSEVEPARRDTVPQGRVSDATPTVEQKRQ